MARDAKTRVETAFEGCSGGVRPTGASVRPPAPFQHNIPHLAKAAISNPYMAGWDYVSPIWDTGKAQTARQSWTIRGCRTNRFGRRPSSPCLPFPPAFPRQIQGHRHARLGQLFRIPPQDRIAQPAVPQRESAVRRGGAPLKPSQPDYVHIFCTLCTIHMYTTAAPPYSRSSPASPSRSSTSGGGPSKLGSGTFPTYPRSRIPSSEVQNPVDTMSRN